MKKLAVFTVAVLLTGCASLDRTRVTQFHPIAGSDDTAFSFVTGASRIDSEDNAKAEVKRMKWLDTWIAENNYCNSGYKITSRKPINNGNGGHTIYYEGVCL